MQDLMAEDLYRPFRPYRAPRVAYPVGVAWLALMLVLALFPPAPLGWLDRVGFVLVGVVVMWFLHRQASVAALPSHDGLRVRNLFLTRDLGWAEIVSVHFGGGAPWATLDLTDTDTLSVMAVQRADGERGVAEARRLATLVARHTATDRDD